MFGELHRQTLDILAERAENYLFDDAEDSAEEPPKEEKCNVVSAQALFNTLKATYDLEENINEMEENAQVLTLRRCMDKVTALQAQKSAGAENLHELQSKYNSVTDKTSSLHNACDRMMSQQTQLAAGTEQLKTNLHYYQQYDWIMKKLQTSKLSLTGTLFAQILSSIHECMSYLKANPEHKEAETYIRKYEHCLSRALSAIKLGVMSDLESCKNEVLYRQAKASSQPTAADGAVGMTYADDDTFALLYGVFGVKANAVRNAVSLGHQYFSEYPEFQSMVMECEEAYFQIREHLLRPIVNATVQQLSQKHKESSCTFTRDGCNFLLRLADDEYRLYKQFFVVRSADGSGSKSVAASPPMTPRPAFFWQQSSFTFDSFIEGLCQILYDALRPLIIHNQHLETLAQLCTHLKIEMIEERCGMLMSAMGTDDEPDEAINPRAGFARVMSGLVGDIVERIVYRTSLYAQSDILGYNPAHGDLTYPERLLMMKDIENKSIPPATPDADPTSSAPLSKQSSSSAIDLHCLWYPTVRRTVMCLSKLYKCLDHTVFVSVSRELLDACCQSLELAADKIRQLPIDPAKATAKNLGRSLDAELFLVKHLLIIREQTSPYRVTSKSRTFSREDVDSTASRFDYAIDLSKYKNSMYELLNPENRSRWFELSSNNAIISFLLSAPVQVSELQTDSRRIIESQLKKHCQRLIRFVTDLFIGGLFNLSQAIAAVESVEGAAQAEAMKEEALKPKAVNDAVSVAFKNLKQNWAQIRSGFSLYIGSRETEEILLQPIRKAIVDVFTNVNLFTQKNFTEEQRQVASVPNQEQIWLLLNSS